MSIKNLAECIIIQSLLDISKPSAKRDSVAFLTGRRLVECAEVAGMNGEEITSLRNIVRRYIMRASVSGRLDAAKAAKLKSKKISNLSRTKGAHKPASSKAPVCPN